jgi:hypothetical protein
MRVDVWLNAYERPVRFVQLVGRVLSVHVHEKAVFITCMLVWSG